MTKKSGIEGSMIGVSFGARQALSSVNISLTSGRTALVGVNGAGKSTLMSVLSGRLRPTSGHVSLGELDLYGKWRKHALPRVSLMPQNTSFPGSMTALEVVEYLTWMRGVPSKTCRTRAQEALAAVGLDERKKSRMSTLSGGMARRVALAQAIAAQADVVLLDEPSTGLDPHQRSIMVDQLKKLTGPVLMSSHILEDVIEVADRVVVLDEGSIKYDGSVDGLVALAPAGSNPAKSAEIGFLSLIATRGIS